MPHPRIPPARSDRTGLLPETAITAPARRPRPRRPRWAAASADFVESLLGEGAGDPLTLLAEVFAVAADAERVCVAGPPLVAPGDDAGPQGALVVHAAHDRSAIQPDGTAFPAAASLCGRVLATGRPFLIAGGDREAPGHELFPMVGPTLVLPVGGGKTGRPALALMASRPGGAPPFTAGDLAAAADFVRLADASLRFERGSADRALLAVLADRDRIARELHDRVIQRVFAAGLAVRALGGMTADPELGQRLADEGGALDAVIVEIRTAILALTIQAHPDRPSARRRVLDLLDELGPLFAHPPRVHFSGAIDLLVTAPLADDLVAVLREGLANVLRHARAGEVEVSVCAAADTLTVEISDDGVGPAGNGRRSGVANLSFRAERWQGIASLTPREPCGALLRWTARLPGAPVRAAR